MMLCPDESGRHHDVCLNWLRESKPPWLGRKTAGAAHACKQSRYQCSPLPMRSSIRLVPATKNTRPLAAEPVGSK